MRRDDTLRTGRSRFLHSDWRVEHWKRDTCVLQIVHYRLGHIALYYLICSQNLLRHDALSDAVKGRSSICTETRKSVALAQAAKKANTLAWYKTYLISVDTILPHQTALDRARRSRRSAPHPP